MIKEFLLILTFFAILSCSKNDKVAESNANFMEIIPESKSVQTPSPPKEEAPMENSKEKDSPDNELKISKKIIKNGEMSIAVGKISEAKTKVENVIKKNNGYTQNETFRNSDTAEELNLTIRVPYQNFDSLINSFSNGIGSVEFKTITADDVTEEYTEISIRLANKKIYLEKYRDMLKKAGTTKDILQIQENIRELEDEIDVAEGRLRFIDDRVNYSTLNLSLFKEKVRSSTTSKIGFGSRFGDSLTEGWNSFICFFLGVISFWPFLVLTPLLVFIWKKWKAKKRHEKIQKN